MTFKKFISTAAVAIFVSTAAASAVAGTHSQAPGHGQSTEMKSDIVDTAVNASTFNTLVSAVQAAGLEATLRSEGPFTVFAPTDAAFAKLPSGTVESLLRPENKDKLVSILTYHVVPGKVKSSSLVSQKLAVESVQGSNIFVDGRDGVKVDGAAVVTPDIRTSNGIIHVIDTVIMP